MRYTPPDYICLWAYDTLERLKNTGRCGDKLPSCSYHLGVRRQECPFCFSSYSRYIQHKRNYNCKFYYSYTQYLRKILFVSLKIFFNNDQFKWCGHNNFSRGVTGYPKLLAHSSIPFHSHVHPCHQYSGIPGDAVSAFGFNICLV